MTTTEHLTGSLVRSTVFSNGTWKPEVPVGTLVTFNRENVTERGYVYARLADRPRYTRVIHVSLVRPL